MGQFSIWMQAVRPKTLIASLSPVLLSAALSKPSTLHQWLLFAMILLTALGIQVVANLANDTFDFLKGADNANRKGPTRVMASGLVTLQEMRWALGISVGITALTGSFLVLEGGWLFACLVALALVLAFLYTAGPYPLAYLGLGDLCVFVFFGPVAVAAPLYLMTGTWELTPFLVGLAPAGLSTTLLAINNLRDVDEDKQAHKKTLIVRFGTRFGKGEAISCLLLPLFVPLLFLSTHPFAWMISLGMLLPSVRHAMKIGKNSDPLVYNRLLAHTAQLLFLFTGLFCVCWNLS